MGVWDEKENDWNEEYIEDLSYMDKLLKFKTMKLAPMAFIQSRCTDYPYNRWELRCIENEKAILEVETKRITMVFEIGTTYVKLIERKEEEFAELVDVEMSPGFLLLELSKCGIHLLPVDEDAKLGGIELKNKQAEENAIADIVSSVRSYAFRSCKWNK